MDKKSKILFFVFGSIVIASFTISFMRYIVFQDYLVEMSIDCDPSRESCFVYECDPVEEECSEDPEEDIWYYKILEKKAYAFPECFSHGECYEEIMCLPEERNCSVILCNPEEEMCYGPEKHNESGEELGEEWEEDFQE